MQQLVEQPSPPPLQSQSFDPPRARFIVCGVRVALVVSMFTISYSHIGSHDTFKGVERSFDLRAWKSVLIDYDRFLKGYRMGYISPHKSGRARPCAAGARRTGLRRRAEKWLYETAL